MQLAKTASQFSKTSPNLLDEGNEDLSQSNLRSPNKGGGGENVDFDSSDSGSGSSAGNKTVREGIGLVSSSVGSGYLPSSGQDATVSQTNVWSSNSSAKVSNAMPTLNDMVHRRSRVSELEQESMTSASRDGDSSHRIDDPSHNFGFIQSFGCLIAVREADDEGSLEVRQCSENTEKILGLSPAYLFSLNSFLDCLDDDQAEYLRDHIEALSEPQDKETESDPSVFQLNGWSQGETGTRKRWDCWCAAHCVATTRKDEPEVNVQPKPIIALEFELVHDKVNPLAHFLPQQLFKEKESEAEAGPNRLTRLASSASLDEIREPSATVAVDSVVALNEVPIEGTPKAVVNSEHKPYLPASENPAELRNPLSRPSKAVDHPRRSAAGQANEHRFRPGRTRSSQNPIKNLGEGRSMLDMFGILSQVNGRMQAQNDIQDLFTVAVSAIRELTGFSRAVLYRFDQRWNSQVVHKLLDWNQKNEPYKGVHSPDIDISKQAQNLCKINKIQVLYDRDLHPAKLICKDVIELRRPIDTSRCFLLAVRPNRLRHLARMGVRASMSVSITAFNQLWGFLALHTYDAKGRRVSFPMRQLCRLLGDSIARNIERLTHTKHLSVSSPTKALRTDVNTSKLLISNAAELLVHFDAEFGALALGDEMDVLGPPNVEPEVVDIARYLQSKKFRRVVISEHISADFPDLALSNDSSKDITSLLLIPLSETGADFIVFFR
ncbi:hypothetical protein FA10DRAFT_199939 [Acaromyces ingoldii]|uniref:Phytochrome chromophore attachment site domain-containing protein n=1 Tax=Acaromyces ingoldii TaxID=215250 RepID=A0A316YD58_9BASI|nr:hypothetical protein FA10DRAFT_199939 [Acaromyces ingoldii]PWN86784.1 hypothetical protein FA10DRAFT_199939 [Acaromyces ingoldii]